MASTCMAELLAMRDTALEAIVAAKEKGRKVVGYYCTYSPIELAIAAGAIVVPLCGSKEGALTAADNDLPQNLCPVVKNLYDLAVTDTCPFFHFSDMIIAETTCDGKKKVYEFLSKIKYYHIMDLPQIAELSSSLQAWEAEIKRLKKAMEIAFGVVITDESLRKAIHLTNEDARVRKKLFDLNQADPPPVTGSEMLAISGNAEFAPDKWAAVALMERFAQEKITEAGRNRPAGSKKPRILLTGCPIGTHKGKVIELVEECGGQIVAMENCGAYKTVDLRIDENDPRDPVTLLAEKYIKVPCSVMSPNEGRMRLLESMMTDFNVGGVIDLTWQACHTYNIEAKLVNDLVNDRNLAFLHVETDFSDSDRENLRVRIEAFLEMIRGK